MKETTKKGVAIAIAAVAGLGLAGAGALIGANAFPKEVEVPGPIEYKEKVVNKTVEVPVEVVREVPVNVTKEVEVLVDNGNYDTVLEHIFDNDGKVQYLTKDLDADEVAEIGDRVIFVNEIKAIAAAEVEKEVSELVDKETVNGEKLDEDDVEKVRVDDDAEDIEIDSIDFEDQDAELLVKFDFEHDDVDYEGVARVEFRDGVIDDISLESLDEE